MQSRILNLYAIRVDRLSLWRVKLTGDLRLSGHGVRFSALVDRYPKGEEASLRLWALFALRARPRYISAGTPKLDISFWPVPAHYHC
jgi:hypothetical protein